MKSVGIYQEEVAVPYIIRGAGALAGVVIIALVTVHDFSDRQFFLWLAACTVGAALVLWGVKGLLARRLPGSRGTRDG